jgi:hypothetical protein
MNPSSMLPAAVFLSAVSLAPAQETQLTVSAPSADNKFGYSVSLDSGIALVGAREDDSSRGSAYLFDADPASPTYGEQLIKLQASDGFLLDVFGAAVALGGGRALVGAPYDDDLGPDSGSAYLFDADPASATFGSELVKLTQANANSQFGVSVALSYGYALVGAHRTRLNNVIQSGSAYLFDADPSSPSFGTLLLAVEAADASPYDHFGISVALSDGLALVGAWEDDDMGDNSGSAYLFDVDPSSPTFGAQLFKFTASDGAAIDRFGRSVALAEGLALVGGIISDGTVPNTGAAYLFNADPTSASFGQELVKLSASDGVSGDYFGQSVAIDNGKALVGAPHRDGAGVSWGSAYVFGADPLLTTFGQELARLDASNGADYDNYGAGVSLEDGLVLVGAPGMVGASTGRTGSSYLIENDCTGAITNVCQTSPNSVGAGAEMISAGLPSISSNDLALAAIWCPPHQFGIFYYGPAGALVPFGNGVRCVGPGGVGLFRFSPVNTGLLGVGIWNLDNTSPPQASGQVTSGSTWHFQFWYRDPAAGGAYFNLSDALEIRFCP